MLFPLKVSEKYSISWSLFLHKRFLEHQSQKQPVSDELKKNIIPKEIGSVPLEAKSRHSPAQLHGGPDDSRRNHQRNGSLFGIAVTIQNSGLDMYIQYKYVSMAMNVQLSWNH